MERREFLKMSVGLIMVPPLPLLPLPSLPIPPQDRTFEDYVREYNELWERYDEEYPDNQERNIEAICKYVGIDS